ncbi:PAS domain S-box protein [Streptomyces sp. NBC_01381]|uniref:helix-turn-helix transcriptional regulator n=1 Tax=Streptomyces sp. NBC_01381 TaxID=2903845 RepID=UPI0022503CC3|nr:PAS domain S-box protein [Streptomyces sp. NBC_01381]MCX4668949.1 PAS domain S-box protein [Streptomyces sp. NBC_01381]
MDTAPSTDSVLWRNRAMRLFDRIPTPVAVCAADGAIILANPAMAAEWGSAPGALRDRNVLELFRPEEKTQVVRIVEALRLGRRSRYPVAVRWEAADGVRRHGELTAEPVSDTADEVPGLLVLLRVLGEDTAPAAPETTAVATPSEARILALLATGATTERAARETGLTRDGVTYHLRRLTERWGASNRTELVARAYALGVLVPGEWPPKVAAAATGGQPIG